MRRIRPRSAALLAAGVLFPLAPDLPGQKPAVGAGTAAVLVGEVSSAADLRPLAHARVGLVGTERWTFTDAHGRFRLTELPPGAQRVQVTFLGIESDPSDVVLTPGDIRDVRIRFDLQLVPIEATIDGRTVVEGKLRGFYERMEREQGYYITGEQIRHRDPGRTSDMLRQIPGVRIRRGALGPAGVSMSPLPRSCPIEYYLDGVRTPFLDPDNVPPQDIVGIEIYRGLARVPVEFRHRARGCGVIVIWTHDPGAS